MPRTAKKPPLTDQARLEALRGRLEAILADPETSPRDVATVSREYRMIIESLAAVTPVPGSSRLDEISARRRRRGA
jgi:hypothetical protein